MAIPIKIGNYKLGKTLGSGSFGKVKCKLIFINIVVYYFSNIFVNSGNKWNYTIESCNKNSEQEKNKNPQHVR